jgi:membrane-bound serine protease (ClpP class)
MARRIRKRLKKSRPGRRPRWPVALCVLGLAILAASGVRDREGRADTDDDSAAAAPAEGRVGRLVRVPLPIRGLVDDNVKRAVTRLMNELPKDGPRPVLILEFWPQPNTKGEGSEFERSLSLARFLTSERMSRVRTIAYLPKSVVGHAVLPVIACEQIIMHPEAEFGNAGADEQSIDATVRRGYTEIANRRRTVPSAVALGLLDKELQVFAVNGERYVLADELAELKESGAVAEIETVIPAGETGNFTGNDMQKKYSFASHLVSDRGELAQVLGLPANSVDVDASYGRAWQAIRVRLSGPVNNRSVSQAENAISDSMRAKDVNFILVEIDSPGGSPIDSVALAQYLAAAGTDERQIRTVAYIPRQALADATVIAMACDHVVMLPDAKLGGSGTHELRSHEVNTLRDEVLPSLAQQKSRSWSLWAAMIDSDLEVSLYKQQGSGVSGYFCDVELAEQVDPGSWTRVETVTRPGAALKLTGDQTHEMGLARFVVSDLEEVKQVYRLEGELTTVKPNWAMQLIDALAQREIAWMLLFVGGFAFMSEMSAPGIGIPGFVAAVCFVFFFWSQFLHGTAHWFEILLFVGGMIFIAMEVLVLPGFGIFGLGGGVMVIASIVLATQTFIVPRNDYQFSQMPQSFLPLVAMCIGGAAALVLMRHFLPRAPVVSQVMLPPPDEDEMEEISRREALVSWEHLVGKQGKTTTLLMPAGKARFGDDMIDVISQGEVIERDTNIRVLEVHGNRVIVEPVEPT